MAKLTDEQIENELKRIGSVSNDIPGRALLREAFTLGKDHGEACVIERAAELVAPAFGNAQNEALGRAVSILVMWQLGNKDRCWNVNTSTSKPSVWFNAGEGEFLGADICGPKSYHYETGADIFEAFAKAAAWCVEHSAASVATPPKAYDGLPDTLPRIEPADIVDVPYRASTELVEYVSEDTEPNL
jgi:hypothetical protein